MSFSKTHSYTKLLPPHSEVHHATHRLFQLLESGDAENINAVAEDIAQMEEASTHLFQILDRMLKEKRG